MTGVYPAGMVLHLPHDATAIPPWVWGQFVLDDRELAAEMARMTDHLTRELFAGRNPGISVVAAPVSRLVVDVERFEQDEQEPMAVHGLGVIYRNRSDGGPLRRELLADEREALLAAYYRPHHRQLYEAVEADLAASGHCLILDGHSFPASPLPYELDQCPDRADICIGTDDFHTPDFVWEAFVDAFSRAGFSVAVNCPFAGALVPLEHYQKDRNVLSVMVEINRALYLEETSAAPLPSFDELAERIQLACCDASWMVMRRMQEGMGRPVPKDMGNANSHQQAWTSG